MLGYAVVSIAGIDLVDANDVPCKCYVLDGVNLQMTATASQQFAANGEVHTQAFETSKGQAFGILAEFLPPDKLNAAIAAMMAAVAAGNSFNVTALDDIHDIDTDCTLDFTQKAIDYPKQRTHEDVVKEATFRFLTV